MPASSRKRNKGKDRKAKKLEKERVRINKFWWGWIIGDPHTGNIVQCHHGINGENPDDSHPVSNFMDAFFINWYDKQIYVLEIIKDMFQSHRDIFISDKHRDMVIKAFTRIGTNMVLAHGDKAGDTNDLSNARCVAKVITILENYIGTGDVILTINGRSVSSKMRDLDCEFSNRRDVLKFYRKRISCKCLKKMHLEERIKEVYSKDGILLGL